MNQYLDLDGLFSFFDATTGLKCCSQASKLPWLKAIYWHIPGRMIVLLREEALVCVVGSTSRIV